MAEYAVVKNDKGRYEIRKSTNNIDRPDRPYISWWGKAGYWIDDYDRKEGRRTKNKDYGSKTYFFKRTAIKQMEELTTTTPDVEVIVTKVVPDPAPFGRQPAAMPFEADIDF